MQNLALTRLAHVKDVLLLFDSPTFLYKPTLLPFKTHDIDEARTIRHNPCHLLSNWLDGELTTFLQMRFDHMVPHTYIVFHILHILVVVSCTFNQSSLFVMTS